MTTHARQPRGFTLIEMLVVVVIIGILASTVVLGFVGSDREQNLRTEAERLAAADRDGAFGGGAAQRRMGRSRSAPDGLSVPRASIRCTHSWVEQKSSPFHPRETA